KSWTAVVWNSAVQTSSSIGTSWYLSCSAIGNITHLTFLSSLNNKRYTYFNYTSNTFASETSIGIGTAVDNAPVMSVNSTSNDIWIMWADSPSTYSQFYYKLYNNSISSWGSDTNYFNETITVPQDKLISPYKFTGKFGIAYVNGTATYSVNFVLVEVVVAVLKSWHSVSTWTANLAARIWSSGTSWSLNIQTRQWNSIYVYAPSLYEYYNTDDDESTVMYDINWTAQTFTTGATAHTITSVRLLLYRGGSPGTCIVSIKATNVTDGHPTGSDLTNGTIDGNSLTDNPAGVWYRITFTEYMLNASTKYAIVVQAPDGNAYNNALYWLIDSTTPTYADGIFEYSFDSGSTWTSNNEDLMFEVWGTGAVLFSFGLTTMMWQPVVSSAFNLLVMAWTDIAAWGIDLLTMAWNDVATYAVNIIARALQDVASWLFTLLPRLIEWVKVALWILILQPQSRSGLLLICIVIGVILSLGFVRLLALKKRKTTQTTAEMLYRLSYRIRRKESFQRWFCL
ncbi:hypothetical protein MUP59_00410, partial [Candidatus Bathyarchaeota archaeon]|nr:hypothetical protein [Candidatus Bathyarchaeota archaeon]